MAGGLVSNLSCRLLYLSLELKPEQPFFLSSFRSISLGQQTFWAKGPSGISRTCHEYPHKTCAITGMIKDKILNYWTVGLLLGLPKSGDPATAPYLYPFSGRQTYFQTKHWALSLQPFLISKNASEIYVGFTLAFHLHGF